MNSNSNALLDCQSAIAVTNTPGFQRLIILELIASIFAIVANLLFLSLVRRIGVFHLNLKLLLANFNFVLLAYGIGFFIKSLQTLIKTWTGDFCGFSMKSYDCKIHELMVALPNSCVNYASLATCLERVYCTVRYKRYGDTGLIKPWISIFLLIACYAVTFGHQLGMLSSMPRNLDTAFCENLLSLSSEAAMTGSSLLLTAEIASVSLSVVVYFYNKYQLKRGSVNRCNENLASRYQLDQNVKINRLLMPSMIWEAVCYVPTLTFLLLLTKGVEMGLETKTFWIHVTYNCKLLFAFTQPILAFTLNPQVKKALRDSCPGLIVWFRIGNAQVAPATSMTENPARIANVHFHQSAKLWSSIVVSKS